MRPVAVAERFVGVLSATLTMAARPEESICVKRGDVAFADVEYNRVEESGVAWDDIDNGAIRFRPIVLRAIRKGGGCVPIE